MRLEVLRPIRFKRAGQVSTLTPGETVEVRDPQKAKPLILSGHLRVAPTPEVQAHNESARDLIAQHYREEVLPRLLRLQRAGKLPKDWALREDWLQVEDAWNRAAEGSEAPCNPEEAMGLASKYAAKWEGEDKTPSVDPQARPCFACKEINRWVSIYGVRVCGACHPPARADLVDRWE